MIFFGVMLFLYRILNWWCKRKQKSSNLWNFNTIKITRNFPHLPLFNFAPTPPMCLNVLHKMGIHTFLLQGISITDTFRVGGEAAETSKHSKDLKTKSRDHLYPLGIPLASFFLFGQWEIQMLWKVSAALGWDHAPTWRDPTGDWNLELGQRGK